MQNMHIDQLLYLHFIIDASPPFPPLQQGHFFAIFSSNIWFRVQRFDFKAKAQTTLKFENHKLEYKISPIFEFLFSHIPKRSTFMQNVKT